MAETQHGLELYFQPFSALEYRTDVPILCIVFEDQPDLILTKAFPEVEALRLRFDMMDKHGEETVTLFNVVRGQSIIPLAIIYIRNPWRRQRNAEKWNVDNINFYREVWERTYFAANHLRMHKYDKAVFVLPSRFQPDNIKRDRLQERRLEKFVRTLAEAITAANHHLLDEFKQRKDPRLSAVTLTFFGEGGREVDEFFRRSMREGQAIGEAMGYTRRLIQLPPNHKYPVRLAEQATGAKLRTVKSSSKSWHKVSEHGFSSQTTVSYLYGTEGIGKFGMGLVAAVGKGSEHQPLFLKTHYRPKTDREKKVKKVVIIGKGVTYDTGGLSLKSNADQENIHYDMGGAATALGVLKLADALGLPVEIVVLTPLVENAIGHAATRRHDIVKAYNGKTVEIIDPDAEGRLIMADAIAYSERHLRADCTVTLSTLCAMGDLGPDLLKIGMGNGRLEKKVKRAEWDSCEKMLLLPRVEHFNWVDNEHVGDVSDLLQEPGSVYYHTAPFVFLSDFFAYAEPEWVFVDVSAIFETDADNYAAGPGFGLKFVWHLVKQLA
ncbi:MAG: hypothetical protein A3C93_01050 [Candidatus Lloydbacteria bacterium RIFCSPHIGHO2_02_FULL_54_17]|uniref:Cytosol aminopeptidase domain-containing protein n=1 Tax=Candidatus Lloydbacteria bacterium RIFCSPHIGHO2_02_FULL_54_17 TaxID=1798664 RepID=A0A1G2DH49_9BACT|nr:MAG: hypothetical protein A2762_05785 [Candidatus Lloydbacteria bacterium RIFCSPHIGHO2_01_FULL_54_11]OGZ12929.1 MAG: hypothetical protein A3C93_01050 [Candidatus Lloydbacteria bacterium RIFCSPHIGHO2_02_FULL_54_17]OGZ15008.1 MAG: hypothetical protein A2948_00975 [Candidatus Lloydbacteria bacterium RIFCSPLOWO2_01_FULL_54_18]OGZ16929.1 MAG: hypothetical protein A3H76_05885 [Candidatus Lloydbacteria bacterium RIFCSPLOWO2_02_FULL_54_12]